MEKRINPLELTKKEVVATSEKVEPKQEKIVDTQPAPSTKKASKGSCPVLAFFAKLFKKGENK